MWEGKMKLNRRENSFRLLAFLVVSSLIILNPLTANATSKSITCYKGSASKKVSGANPKCPAGWSAKKIASSTSGATSSTASTSGVAFNATYKGKITLVWSESSVKVTSVNATGTGNNSGLTEMKGTASAAPTNQCDGFEGTGTISGGGNSLTLAFDDSAKGCAEDGAAPTSVNVTGNAVIKSGTGKFAGATGTLKVTGSFPIQSSAAGSTENSNFTLTISGNIATK